MTKVLIVDDELICLETTQALLSMRGFDVEAVADAEAAIQRGREFLPDVLVTDQMLGGKIDGIEVALALRKAVPGVRVIVITGYASVGLQSQIEALPNACCLCKPIPLEQLIAAFNDSPA